MGCRAHVIVWKALVCTRARQRGGKSKSTCTATLRALEWPATKRRMLLIDGTTGWLEGAIPNPPGSCLPALLLWTAMGLHPATMYSKSPPEAPPPLSKRALQPQKEAQGHPVAPAARMAPTEGPMARSSLHGNCRLCLICQKRSPITLVHTILGRNTYKAALSLPACLPSSAFPAFHCAPHDR